MKRKSFLSLLLAVAMTLTVGAGLTLAAHPDIPLYTYEEVATAFGEPMMPVMINPATMEGMPYSPKQTCGNCHNGTTTSWDQQFSFAAPLVSYEEMSTQAFHAELGAENWKHSETSEGATTQPGKPWSRTTGMFGKW